MRDALKDLIHLSERGLDPSSSFSQKAIVQSLAEMLAFVCLAAHLLPLVEGC